MRPVLIVALKAASFIYAIISTSLVRYSCTITGISPSELRVSSEKLNFASNPLTSIPSSAQKDLMPIMVSEAALSSGPKNPAAISFFRSSESCPGVAAGIGKNTGMIVVSVIRLKAFLSKESAALTAIIWLTSSGSSAGPFLSSSVSPMHTAIFSLPKRLETSSVSSTFEALL